MELNRDQIVKALECCVNHMCNECPLRDGRCANGEMGRLALAIIKELTEENERLHASCTELEQKCASVKSDTVRKMQERLKAQKFTHKNLGELVYVEDIDQIANELLEGSDET